MSGCLLSPKACYAIWSCFQDATLFDFNRLMLRRFATLHTSCCLPFLLLSDSLIWSSRCYAVWSSLSHATLLALTASCYAVSGWTSPACCLILASWLWAAGSFLPHAMLLDPPCLLFCCLNFPQSYFVFVFVFMIVLCCLALSSWCCAAWPLYIMPCYLVDVLWAPTNLGTTSFFALGISSKISYPFLVSSRNSCCWSETSKTADPVMDLLGNSFGNISVERKSPLVNSFSIRQFIWEYIRGKE